MKNTFILLFVFCFGISALQSCSSSSVPCQDADGNSIETPVTSNFCTHGSCGGSFTISVGNLQTGYSSFALLDAEGNKIATNNTGLSDETENKFRCCVYPITAPSPYQMEFTYNDVSCTSPPFVLQGSSFTASKLSAYLTENTDLSIPSDPSLHQLCFGSVSDVVLDIRSSVNIAERYELRYTPQLSNNSWGAGVSNYLRFTPDEPAPNSNSGIIKLSDQFTLPVHTGGIQDTTRFKVDVIANYCDGSTGIETFITSINTGCSTTTSLPPTEM